ncbi:uncharacterized protein [Pseudorca crassidens]|uniref:uncharacterized protein isoform X3 n=1 Tax=Pseudorca crassidens TaxID=82174 RepID=UPI00352C57B9
METLCVGVWPPEVASRSGAAAPARPAGNRRETLKGSNRQRAGGTGPLGTRSLKAGISVFPAAGRSATHLSPAWRMEATSPKKTQLLTGELALLIHYQILFYTLQLEILLEHMPDHIASLLKTLPGLPSHSKEKVSSIREKPDLDLMGRKMDLDHKPQPRKKKKVNNSSHH